jgi:hypothetical protein
MKPPRYSRRWTPPRMPRPSVPNGGIGTRSKFADMVAFSCGNRRPPSGKLDPRSGPGDLLGHLAEGTLVGIAKARDERPRVDRSDLENAQPESGRTAAANLPACVSRTARRLESHKHRHSSPPARSSSSSDWVQQRFSGTDVIVLFNMTSIRPPPFCRATNPRSRC